jgi:hypothetical protein
MDTIPGISYSEFSDRHPPVIFLENQHVPYHSYSNNSAYWIPSWIHSRWNEKKELLNLLIDNVKKFHICLD